MSSGLILETCPASPPWILMQFRYAFILIPIGQMQNISSMPAKISQLQALYFLHRFIEKVIESRLNYLKSM